MERLETKSAYRIVAEFQIASGRRYASVGLKATGLDVSFDDGQVLHYDLEGRLARVATPNVQWRRGLSHRTVRLQKRAADAGGGLDAQLLDREASDRIVDEASRRLAGVPEAFSERQFVLLRGESMHGSAWQQFESLLGKSAAFDASAARDDLRRFTAVYGDIPILPPDQYGSLVLLATDGCAYNECTFCGFYRGAGFRRRSPQEFREHVHEAFAYHGESLATRRGIFLGQANALLGPRAWREEVLEIVQQEFEFPPTRESAVSARWWQGSARRFTGVSSFLDAFTGDHILAEEFARLRQRQLRRIYLGVESGDPHLLAWLNKPSTPERMLRVVENAKEGGVQVGVIILIGAGGEPYFQSHARRTLELLNAMRLGRGDYVYLSPLVDMPGTPYHREAALAEIQPLSSARMAEQTRILREGLAFSSEDRPYVAEYDVSRFIY